MFEKLLEFLLQFWQRLSPIEIVRHYEKAAVLRLGIFNRALEPGLHWKWPLIEEVIEGTASITTLRLPPQTLTTKDDVGVVISAIVKYQIINIEPYVTLIWDQHDVLADTTMGAVRKAVAEMTWSELREETPEKRVLEFVRNEVNRFGFKIHAITFIDLGRVRSLRLIQQVAKDIDN